VFFSSLDGAAITDQDTYTLGYEFEVNTPITVIGLSVFTGYPSIGFSKSTPIGLWNDSQTEIASATVLAGTADPLTTDGYFRYATLPIPVTLPDGDYYVGAEIDGAVSGFYE